MDDGGITYARPSKSAYIPVVDLIVSSKDGTLRELALIDTGARHNFIEITLAERLGLPVTGGPFDVSAVGTSFPAYARHLKATFGGTKLAIESGFLAVDMINSGRKYSFILGIAGIENFRLTLNFKRHKYFLDTGAT
ncbi:retroviral-like aspartic protease [Rhodobacter sp. NTK016B]|uniref:retropepsin-like aspartic protease n=1 Tax=Rhodobacter sp. NTK016B TaxID=2759676 RepID=UPI001A8FBFA4|nr:retropepsin-like aspartic protease [Rhodobacter sp. NTK016B]MBN8291026.1 retroviral-like aspartic protease [Rhodobacter sp. NTK016B]